MSKLKRFLKSHPKLLRVCFAFYNALPFNNKIKGGRHNKIVSNGLLQGCKIVFVGKNNTVEIQNGAILRQCTFHISGNYNHIVFAQNSFAKLADLCTEDDRNSIVIGQGTNLCGKIHLAAIEGTNIIIGKDCLFSSEIVFRTGDSHSILDLDGNRINPSQDIVIGDHVWLGHRVLINKGVQIAKNNIVGTAAVVTKSIPDTNSVIAGVPAKVVKKNIDWRAER